MTNTIDNKAEIGLYEAANQTNVVQHKEDEIKHGDAALKLVGDVRVAVTPAENRALARKTDKYILSVLMLVYFLQVVDKTNMGQANLLGLSSALDLHGEQYSLLNVILSAAQLAWQPFSSYLLVRVPPRALMTILIFLWGTCQAIMGACTTWRSMMALRFLLGLSEAGCLPLFSILTAQFYRRSEQPIRIAAWYSMNGIAGIIVAIITYGLAHIKSPTIEPYQALFILCGCLTVAATPIVWIFIDSTVAEARFFNEDEKVKAIERLRANQTGTGSTEFKWHQAWEMFYDVKSYCFAGIAICINAGSSITGSFGPTLIAGFGFDKYTSALLNIPFSVLQLLVILAASYGTQKLKSKSGWLLFLPMPCIAGCVMLYVTGTAAVYSRSVALGGYYLLAFIFGGNPLIISWMIANTGGQTKKSAVLALYNASSAAGNIIGPLLFDAKDAPHYLPGIKGCLGIFCALLALVAIQVVVLYGLNRIRRRQRLAHGKPEFIKDTSMSARYETYGAAEGEEALGQNALLDLTDYQNDEFTYVY